MQHANRFARTFDELTLDERHLVEPAIKAARATFSRFADKPDSMYHAAAGLDPAQTWERVAEELARVSVLAAIDGSRDVVLCAGDIELLHRAIFEPVFGEAVEGFRGRNDGVDFPVVLGTPEAPVAGRRRGVRHKQIRRRLDKALRNFQSDVDRLAEHADDKTLLLADAVAPAIRLYARIIRIHPFSDGNGRTAWAVFSHASQRCGFPLPALPPTNETRWALGAALRDGRRQDFQPLVDIVVQTIKRSAATGDEPLDEG